MRVLHIGLACAHGGAESFLATLVREQKKIGIEADVMFTQDLGASGQFADTCKVFIADQILPEEVLLKGNYDVLHIANHASFWISRAIKRTHYDGAIVVTYHIWGHRDRSIHEDVVVGVSNAVNKAIQSEYEQELRMVYNGIDTDFFSPGEKPKADKPIIAWVGRTNDAAKDVSALIAVALSPAAKDYRIVIADGSPPGEELKAHWLPENVSLEVRKPWLDMPDFYRTVAASKGFLLSTARNEPFGLNAIEAQACGCPAIVPDAGGLPEVVAHKETGYVYPVKSGVAGVTEAIEWLNSGNNYADASEKGIERVRTRFTAEKLCRGYADVYEEAIRLHRPTVKKSVLRSVAACAMPILGPVIRKRRGM